MKWRVEVDGVAIARFRSVRAALTEAWERTREFGRRGHAVVVVDPAGVRAVLCDWCDTGIRPRAPHERSYCTARAARSDQAQCLNTSPAKPFADGGA